MLLHTERLRLWELSTKDFAAVHAFAIFHPPKVTLGRVDGRLLVVDAELQFQ
ncbi:hypothetical protein GCM10027417_17600 [Glutamicibacter endophyticus]